MGVPRPESQFWDPDWALPPEEAPEDPEDNFRTASNLALRFCLALFSRVFSRFDEFDEPEGAFPFPPLPCKKIINPFGVFVGAYL